MAETVRASKVTRIPALWAALCAGQDHRSEHLRQFKTILSGQYLWSLLGDRANGSCRHRRLGGRPRCLPELLRGSVAADSGMAFVVLLHLPIGRRSMLPDILARWTAMRVMEAGSEELLRPMLSYVPPPHAIVTLAEWPTAPYECADGKHAARVHAQSTSSLARCCREGGWDRAFGHRGATAPSNLCSKRSRNAVGARLAGEGTSCRFRSTPGCLQELLRSGLSI